MGYARKDVNVSRKTASSPLKELEEIGLIDMIQQTGVANIIYVKNFDYTGTRGKLHPSNIEIDNNINNNPIKSIISVNR